MLDIVLDRSNNRQVGKQLENRITRLIRSEALCHDQKLPTVRELANQLHINRNTVQRVYRNLNEKGLLETRVGDGTYVASRSDGKTSKLRQTLRVNSRKLIDYALQAGLSPDEISSVIELELACLVKLHSEREIGKIECKQRFADWGRYGAVGSKSVPPNQS